MNVKKLSWLHKKKWGKAIHCRSSEACQVGYGFAHGLTKFV